MSVEIEISLNGAELDVPQIADLMSLRYGVSDANYILEENKTGQYTVLFSTARIGRGTEVSVENGTVNLHLPLPSTPHEIDLFYDLAAAVCSRTGSSGFLRNGDFLPVERAHDHIDDDIFTSTGALEHMTQKTADGEYSQFYVFGALNPISFGQKEIEYVGGSMERFEEMLDCLQKHDAVYSTPRCFRRENGDVFGVYFVHENVQCIFPDKAHLLFNNELEVREWFVMINGQFAVSFDDFLGHAVITDRYDNDNHIISLNENAVEKLSALSVKI